MSGPEQLRKKLWPILSRNSAALQWLMFFFVLEAFLGGFYANQGYWRIDSELASSFLECLSKLMIFFIALRMVRPCGAQDIQTLTAGLLLPTSHDWWFFRLFALKLAVVFCRWNKYSRIIAAALIIWYSTVWNSWPAYVAGCGLTRYEGLWPAQGEFISSTDGIYNLYKFPNYFNGPTYALFRELKVMPGVELVKRLYLCPVGADVQVMRNPDGKYVLVGGTPFSP